MVSIYTPHTGRDISSVRRSRRSWRFNLHAPYGTRRPLHKARPVIYCFNPRAPQGARRHGRGVPAHYRRFQSTRSARSATVLIVCLDLLFCVSIHALHKERDHNQYGVCQGLLVSIHALRKERDHPFLLVASSLIVSIHALRKERDCRVDSTGRNGLRFNPRAPQGARHRLEVRVHRHNVVSIHALRKERDAGGCHRKSGQVCFNPRAPQGARLSPARPSAAADQVSIHALRKERDSTNGILPTIYCVSIHALRKERDPHERRCGNCLPSFNPRAPQGARPTIRRIAARRTCFNPRAPQGARRKPAFFAAVEAWFQSTRSARSATAKVDIKGLFCNASITIIRHICVFS